MIEGNLAVMAGGEEVAQQQKPESSSRTGLLSRSVIFCQFVDVHVVFDGGG